LVSIYQEISLITTKEYSCELWSMPNSNHLSKLWASMTAKRDSRTTIRSLSYPKGTSGVTSSNNSLKLTSISRTKKWMSMKIYLKSYRMWTSSKCSMISERVAKPTQQARKNYRGTTTRKCDYRI
jgi:hypothetical protein